MKLSFTTLSIARDLDLDNTIEMAKAAGCAGIEFRISQGQKHGVELETTKEQRCIIRRKMEDAYLETVSIATGCMFHFVDEKIRRENIEGAKMAAELAHDLSCKYIRVFGNDIPEDVNAQKCVAYVAEALSEVAGYAAPLGVDVLLEMHGKFNFWGYVIEAVKLTGKANVGILYNCDNRDIVKDSVIETYERIAPFMRHVHMHELDSPIFPYMQLFSLLIRDGYTGYLSAEIAYNPDPKRFMSLYGTLYRKLVQLAGYNVCR